MPKYEYACKSCGEHLEVTQTFADAPLTECPSCGGVLRKVFSAPSIAFKGSGFYRTDNRKRRQEPKEPKVDAKSDAAPAAKADSSSSSSPESSGGTKAEPAQKEKAQKETAASTDTKPKAAEAKTA
jgi:putative FmdB family regulatory protein